VGPSLVSWDVDTRHDRVDENVARSPTSVRGCPARRAGSRRRGAESPDLQMVRLPTRPEFGQLIDAIKDRAVLRLDRGGRIIRWNQAAPKILGYSISDLRGRHSAFLFTDDRAGREKASQALEAAAADGAYEHQAWQVRGDGSRFWAEITIAPLATPGRTLEYIVAIRDLTHPKRHAEGLNAALKVSWAILTGLEPALGLQMIAEWARTLVKADLAEVRTVDASGTMLVLRGISERRGSRVARHALPSELPVQGSLYGSVFEAGRPRLLSDPAAALRRLPLAETGEVPDAIPGPTLIVPLRARERSIGILTASNSGGRPPLERHDLETMTVFADHVALAVEEARERRDKERLILAEERRRMGRDIHDGVIQSLYAVTLSLGVAIERAQDQRLHDQLGSVTSHVDAVIANLRSLVRELHSTAKEG